MRKEDLMWWVVLLWIFASSFIDIIDIVTIDSKNGQVSIVRKKEETDKPEKTKKVDSDDIKTDW